MRIVTRLVVALCLTTTAIMVVYGFISMNQRATLLRGALIRETETLGRAAQIVANNALRDGRREDLDRVLARIADDPETVVAAVLGGNGQLLGGGPAGSLVCLREERALEGLAASGGTRGWVRCEDDIRWVALPLRSPGSHVVLGRRATVLERDMATSGRRILLTTFILAAAAAAAIILVLRTTLSAPLSNIMEGVRTLGGPRPPEPVRVPRAAGELRDLAKAFNEMAERLEGKRQALIREVEERVALDRRVRQAETFAALGRLTGGLAHELGTPLNVIEVRAESIEAGVGVPDAARRHAREIVAEVDRVADLIRGLKHVARRHPLEVRPIDLAVVVDHAVNDLGERARSADVAVHAELPVGPIWVDGDGTLLRHAVANLLLNAIEAVERVDGERRIQVGLDRAEDRARIIVADNGPGIDAGDASRLFEPFFTTKDVGRGMGLGLAVAAGIAEEHGGDMVIEPGEGGGARAVFALPLSRSGGAGA